MFSSLTSSLVSSGSGGRQLFSSRIDLMSDPKKKLETCSKYLNN
jgi:hypothetical protein